MQRPNHRVRRAPRMTSVLRLKPELRPPSLSLGHGICGVGWGISPVARLKTSKGRGMFERTSNNGRFGLEHEVEMVFFHGPVKGRLRSEIFGTSIVGARAASGRGRKTRHILLFGVFGIRFSCFRPGCEAKPRESRNHCCCGYSAFFAMTVQHYGTAAVFDFSRERSRFIVLSDLTLKNRVSLERCGKYS